MLNALRHERGLGFNDAGGAGDCDGNAGHLFAPFVTVQQADIRVAMLVGLDDDQERVLRSISVAVGNQVDSLVPLEAKIYHAVKKPSLKIASIGYLVFIDQRRIALVAAIKSTSFALPFGGAYLAECPEFFEEMVRLLYRARRANQRFACQVHHKKIFLFSCTPNHPYISRHPVPVEGRWPSSRTLGRDAVDAAALGA